MLYGHFVPGLAAAPLAITLARQQSFMLAIWSAFSVDIPHTFPIVPGCIPDATKSHTRSIRACGTGFLYPSTLAVLITDHPSISSCCFASFAASGMSPALTANFQSLNNSDLVYFINF
jgi:hypothetical protein